MPSGPAFDDYDPGDDFLTKLHHHPTIHKKLMEKAEECRSLIEKSDDFAVVMTETDEQYQKAVIHPVTNGGIHLELADSVMLKAAAAMEGR